MSEQECFLSVNKHLFFASGAKQPCCSVPLYGTPLKASERKQNSAWQSTAPHVYIQIWDKYMLPFFPCSILNIFTGETVPSSLKSFKLGQFLCPGSCCHQGFHSRIPWKEQWRWTPAFQMVWWHKDKASGPATSTGRLLRRSMAPVFTLCAVASCKQVLAFMEELYCCKLGCERKLIYLCNFMCGQIHSKKSKRIRKAESCLFNGEQILVRNTVCGTWCSRIALCVCVCVQSSSRITQYRAALWVKVYTPLYLCLSTRKGSFCYCERGTKTQLMPDATTYYVLYHVLFCFVLF